MKFRSSQKQELLVYVVLWASLFIAPIISIQFHHGDTEDFPWEELLNVWLQIGNLFVAFLLHNYLLAPLLIYKQRRIAYFSSIAVLTACFVAVQCTQQPKEHFDRKPLHEMHDHRPHKDFLPPTHEKPHEKPHDMRHEKRHDVPPIIFGQQDFIATILLVLMLGMNVGVKLYFKQRDDQQQLAQLEKENLQQQLEYLRYQINPHFLMNTLNNIHALVDIDGERAKETIVELSKIMRYALYEGSRQTVPLSRDIAFLQSYIRLMRLRYTDKVSIAFHLPPQLPDRKVPPMLFITFVENAFKHGVSYQRESFIDVGFTTVGDRLSFSCSNSKHPKASADSQPKEQQQGGVGLKNARQRLQLIYGNDYRLDINDEDGKYNIRLEIPL